MKHGVLSGHQSLDQERHCRLLGTGFPSQGNLVLPCLSLTVRPVTLADGEHASPTELCMIPLPLRHRPPSCGHPFLSLIAPRGMESVVSLLNATVASVC
jgi:hypothetical protein